MNELSQILDEMIETGNHMIEAAEALKRYFCTPPPSPPLTKENVRKLLIEKSDQDGGEHRPEVKALVRKYSENGNFSTVDPERYEALAAELEVIGNA